MITAAQVKAMVRPHSYILVATVSALAWPSDSYLHGIGLAMFRQDARLSYKGGL